MSVRPFLLCWMLSGPLACAQPSNACDPPESTDAGEPIAAPGWRPPSGPCDVDPPEPTRLVVTTTDFSTGAVSVVDLASRRVTRDVAAGSTDAIPTWGRGTVQIVHRFGRDNVELFDSSEATDPSHWPSLGEYPVGTEPRSNPQALVFDPSGLAFVTLMGAPWVEVLDLSAPPAHALVDRIDLSAFADPDGNPDAGVAVACGDTMYVAIRRLDAAAGFRRVDHDALVAVDMHDRKPLDVDRGALRVRGQWIRQLRRDRLDPRGTTLLALTTGIERIDLTTQEVTWAVPAESFAAAGIDHAHLPQAFDVSEDGRIAYLAAYGPDTDDVPCACSPTRCFDRVALYRVGLDGHEPLIPEPFASDFDSVEQTLEVVGDTLWYGSRRHAAAGLWVFDVSADPPVAIDGPLSTGLPPYAVVAIP